MEAHRFGEKLLLLRRGRGWSLSILAGRLGYKSKGYLSEVESGLKRPSLDLVVRTARLFGVTTDQLVLDELEVEDGTRPGRSS